MYYNTKEKDEFYRKSYHGGRNEAFQLGIYEGDYYYYDFTSLYPDVGRRLLPYGDPISCELEEGTELTLEMLQKWKSERMVGIFEIQMKTVDYNKTPSIAYLKDRLLFPHFGNWVVNTLTLPEIQHGLENNIYHFKFIKGDLFKAAGYFSPIFTDVTEIKRQSKLNGETSKAETFKIIGNSIYGGTGMQTYWRSTSRIFSVDDKQGVSFIWARAIDGSLKEIKRIGNSYHIKFYDDLDSDSNVQVASHIAAYARLKLWNLINDIQQLGGKVYYCDTDSVITDLNLMKTRLGGKYINRMGGMGTILGELKDELKGGTIKKLVIGGCKMYGYQTNSDEIVVHLKGWKVDKFDANTKLTLDLLEDLTKGKSITNARSQFKRIRFEHTKYDEPGIYIHDQKVDFKMNYVKGEIQEDGSVKPFIIKNPKINLNWKNP